MDNLTECPDTSSLWWNAAVKPIEFNNIRIANSFLYKFFPFPVRSIIRQNLDFINYLKVAGVNLRGVRFTTRCSLEGSFFWCFDDWSGGYFHWLFDVLPKLVTLVELHGMQKILVPEHVLQNDFVKESLDALGLEPVLLRRDTIYKVRKVYSYCSLPYYDTAHLLKTRNYFLRHYKLSGAPRHDIYVSRRKAGRRRVTNEPELVSTINKSGFEIVCLEDLSFQEQVCLFSQARNVAGLHGAGLANIVFSPKLSILCEIKSEGFENDVFEKLAEALRVKYTTLEIPTAESEMLFADYVVDEEILERKLSELTS